MSFDISYSCVSHIGLHRRVNQDNFICNGVILHDECTRSFSTAGRVSLEQDRLFGVFDGMGGAECGEAAAYIAAKDALDTSVKGPAQQLLETYCDRANLDICAYTAEHALHSCGTTAALVQASRGGITTCNLGDSRIFLFRGGALRQLSRDHVTIAPFGYKPPLLQYLGIPPEEMHLVPCFTFQTLKRGDRYLICSDGLTDMLPPEQLSECMAFGSPQEISAVLLHDALAQGGRDNITLILLEVEKAEGRLARWMGKHFPTGRHSKGRRAQPQG